MSIASTFDKLVDKYNEAYSSNPEYGYFLEEFMNVAKSGKILDLGCGNGIPILRDLIKHGYDVVGVDFSKKMCNMAKKEVPKAQIVCEDMLKYEADEQRFDGAILFFSINHLKHKELVRLFNRLKPMLKEDAGILIGALEGEFEGQTPILGEKVYLRHAKEEEILELLDGFEIVKTERREFQTKNEPVQKQIFILARKKTTSELLDEEIQAKEKKNTKDSQTNQMQKTKEIFEDEDEKPIIKISFFKK